MYTPLGKQKILSQLNILSEIQQIISLFYYFYYCILQLDVIVVDLDGGSIHIPEHVQLSLMPELLHKRMVNALHMVRN